MGGEWSALRPGRALAPGKGFPVPIVQEPVWASELVWTQRLQEKSICLYRGSNIDRPVVQSVARQQYEVIDRINTGLLRIIVVTISKAMLKLF
jgi:hypothetical protein